METSGSLKSLAAREPIRLPAGTISVHRETFV